VVADEHTGLLRYGNDAIDRWSACPAAGRPEWIVKAITTALTVARLRNTRVGGRPAKRSGGHGS
jgi:hypothetical protein